MRETKYNSKRVIFLAIIAMTMGFLAGLLRVPFFFYIANVGIWYWVGMTQKNIKTKHTPFVYRTPEEWREHHLKDHGL